MRIGIFAKYRRDEDTLAVIRLANLALKLGYDVNLLSPHTPAKGVHAFWDTCVSSVDGRVNSTYRWANRCEHLVWFEHNDQCRHMTTVVSKAKHWLIPSWHNSSISLNADMSCYASVVAPAERIKECLIKHVSVNTDLKQFTWVNWDSGLPGVNDELRANEPSTVKLFVPADSYVSEVSGSSLGFTIQYLLHNLRHLKITLSCQSKGSRRFVQQMLKLQALFPKRLTVRFKDGFEARTLLFRSHDWTWLPNPRSNFGQFATQSLICKTPVICYDICPFNEIVTNNENGVLLPCDYLDNNLDVDVAVSKAENDTHALMIALTDKDLLARCRVRALRGRDNNTFELFWENRWSL